jgi:hypothetical protein
MRILGFQHCKNFKTDMYTGISRKGEGRRAGSTFAKIWLASMGTPARFTEVCYGVQSFAGGAAAPTGVLREGELSKSNISSNVFENSSRRVRCRGEPPAVRKRFSINASNDV